MLLCWMFLRVYYVWQFPPKKISSVDSKIGERVVFSWHISSITIFSNEINYGFPFLFCLIVERSLDAGCLFLKDTIGHARRCQIWKMWNLIIYSTCINFWKGLIALMAKTLCKLVFVLKKIDKNGTNFWSTEISPPQVTR